MPRDLIQQRDRLGGTRDPRRRTRQPGLEIIGSGGEELIADMQGFAAGDAAEVALAGQDAPGFIADVDEDVVAAWWGCQLWCVWAGKGGRWERVAGWR